MPFCRIRNLQPLMSSHGPRASSGRRATGRTNDVNEAKSLAIWNGKRKAAVG